MRWVALCFVTACWTQASTPPPVEPRPAPRKIKDIVQPVRIEKHEAVDPCGDPCADPCGGVYGGVVGGVQGGVPGGVVGAPPPPPPPPPPMPPTNVPPTLLEGSRISGEKNIIPDDVTKAEMLRAGKDRVVGSWKLCLMSTGVVQSVSRLKSTGFPQYDAKIESEMRNNWRYRSYMVNGKAVPVCTAVTFIYSQIGAPPPRTPVVPKP